MSIKVIIAGFKGRMGQAAYKMVSEDPELELAGLIDPFTDETEVAGVPVFNHKEYVVGLEADVWVDFTPLPEFPSHCFHILQTYLIMSF